MWMRFKNWYQVNQDAITWFLIGLLIAQGAENISKGQYTWGVILWILAASNYLTRRIRL